MNNQRSSSRRACLLCLAVLAAALVLNGIAAFLPSTLTKWDMTPARRTTLTATSKRFVGGLPEDVTITVLGQNGSINENLALFLSRYTACSSRVRVEIADTPVSAELAERYPGAVALPLHGMIVSSARRARLIDADSMEYYYVEGLGKVDITNYQLMLASEEYRSYLAGYGIDLTSAVHCFDGEAYITAAIEYVTADSVPCFYLLEGDGVRPLGETAKRLLSRLSLAVETLDYAALKATGIPADAAGLLLCAPEEDLSESVYTQVRQFVTEGGNLVLLTDADNVAMPRLMTLMSEMGVGATSDLLYEGNANRYEKTPTTLLPMVNTGHAVCSLVAEDYVLTLPRAHGLSLTDTPGSGFEATVLFRTSDAAYTVAQDGTESEVGETAVGVALENAETGTRVVWISCADVFGEEAIAEFGQGSVPYLMTTVAWESKSFSSTLPAIAAKDMTDGVLSVSGSAFRAWTIIFVVVIPAGALLAGFAIRARRRAR